jgi:chemotaxis protein methyltransferase CheR
MPLSAADFEYVRTLLKHRAAIVLEPERSYRAEMCLLPLARQEGCATVAELIGKMRGGTPNGLHRRAVEAMTINETSFFRDHYPFEALCKCVLPEVMKRRARERRIGIWCAACSTGQEPYSVAMGIREQLPELASWDVRIQGTDLSAAAVARAKAGKFGQLEVNRGLAAPLLVKWFTRAGLEWQAKEELRRMVEFSQANLIGAWPTAGRQIDVVFLRNVLIYFDVETKRRLLERVRTMVGPGGVLFLGGGESTLQLSNGFERVAFGRYAYYRALAEAAPSEGTP